ncbi:type II toxin-antitoxin system Phd/YefM family antitoxin [Caulobacter sp. DWP3-1-3b2]|uniref:type II toxin-antitoxin system Phd/YefM family antitoxin n=1 Tax=Caulobacter sp. DWP3-1-3b2 TaxID=2804643 RepID=UPI003CFBB087
MPITTLSSREFNQDASGAKKAATNGPVFITDRGQPRHVLLSIEDYRRLAGAPRSIADALAMADEAQTELEPPRVMIGVGPADLD